MCGAYFLDCSSVQFVRCVLSAHLSMCLFMRVPGSPALPSGVYNGPVGQDHLKVQDVLPHGPVVHGIGTGCAGGSHAAQRRIGSRV